MKTLEFGDTPRQNSGQDGNRRSASPARRMVAFAAAGALGLSALTGCNPGPTHHYEVIRSVAVFVFEGTCEANRRVLYNESAILSATCETYGNPIRGITGNCTLPIIHMSRRLESDPAVLCVVHGESPSGRRATAIVDTANQFLGGFVRNPQVRLPAQMSCATDCNNVYQICVQAYTSATLVSMDGRPPPADDRFAQELWQFELQEHTEVTFSTTANARINVSVSEPVRY